MSGSAKRTLTPVASSVAPRNGMFAAFSVSSMVPSSAASTFTFADDTCTAGTSGKRFGSAYSAPTRSATAMTMYFQSG